MAKTAKFFLRDTSTLAKGLGRLEQLALEDGKIRRQVDQVCAAVRNNAINQD